jgi:hypothetical protein
MLKLIYTETDLHMELLTTDLEDWVKQRLLFSDSTGEIIFLSSSTASFLLPTTICEATAINYWLATDPGSDRGIFVTQLLDRVEFYLWQLWCSGNSRSILSDGVVN